MTVLENYNKAVEDLAEYFGCEEISWYSVNDETNYFWSINDGYISWAETIEEVNNQDGKYYEEEADQIFRGQKTKEGNLTAVLIKYNREYYWNIFDNGKEIK